MPFTHTIENKRHFCTETRRTSQFYVIVRVSGPLYLIAYHSVGFVFSSLSSSPSVSFLHDETVRKEQFQRRYEIFIAINRPEYRKSIPNEIDK